MLLALDTSTLTLSLALLEQAGSGQRVIAEVLHGPPDKQSELLPGVIGTLLASHRLALDELRGIVVGLGPGSFTGLRVGLACAKALAYAARLPLGGASSLAAVALGGPKDVPLLCLAVARRQELYLGTYLCEGERVRALAAEEALTPAEVAARLAAEPGAVALGPAVAEYGPQLLALGAQPGQLLDTAPVPLARHLAALAELPATFDPQRLFALEPHYVRASEAERNPKFPPLPGPPPSAKIRED
jgi:tRNA threonylcarbamoyladenosine biosynthesis protein TsaB